MKRYTEADQAKMSTSISKMPMASLLKSPSHAPSSSLKVPSFLTFSKPADSAPSKAQTSTKHLQQLRIIPYRTDTPSVSPYDYHSCAKVNKLALNDRSLVAMPNIEQHDVLSDTGAIDPNEDADFIEEVAEHFDMGLPFEHDRDEVVYRLERYKQLRPTLRRFLYGEGCSDEAIVRLFLDKDIKVGGPRSPYAPKILRAQALEDKCHLQQYLNEATRILKMLSPTLLAQQLDVALRIAFAFQEELGMSIWPVSEVWLRQHIRPQAAGEPQRSDFLAGGVCRVCQW